METTTIKVDGMSCGGCVKSVTGVLTALDGVAKADVSLEQKQAAIHTAMLWIKSLHIIFMVTWFAGLFYLPR